MGYSCKRIARLVCQILRARHTNRLLNGIAGNADGLGRVRSKELVQACSMLGVSTLDESALPRTAGMLSVPVAGDSANGAAQSQLAQSPAAYASDCLCCGFSQVDPGDVALVDDTRLADGMHQHWQPQVVAEHVAQAVRRFRPGQVGGLAYGIGHPHRPPGVPILSPSPPTMSACSSSKMRSLCSPPPSPGVHLRWWRRVWTSQPPGSSGGGAALVGCHPQQQQPSQPAAGVAAGNGGPVSQVCWAAGCTAVLGEQGAQTTAADWWRHAAVHQRATAAAGMACTAGAPQPDGVVSSATLVAAQRHVTESDTPHSWNEGK